MPTAWRLAGCGDLDGAAQILRAGDAGDREAVVRLPGLVIKQPRFTRYPGPDQLSASH